MSKGKAQSAQAYPRMISFLYNKLPKFDDFFFPWIHTHVEREAFLRIPTYAPLTM